MGAGLLESSLECSWGVRAREPRGRARRWKRGVLVSQGIAPMENEDWFQQLPLFVAVSLGGGLLGAIFNAAHKAMFQARHPRMVAHAAVPAGCWCMHAGPPGLETWHAISP